MSGTPESGTPARLVVRRGDATTSLPGDMTVTVVTDTHGPDSLRLSLRLPGTAYDDEPEAGFPLQIGDPVTATGITRDETSDDVFSGRVYSIGFERTQYRPGPYFTATAYDHSYLLHHGTHTRTYRDKTDADIAGAIATEVGLQAGQLGPADGGSGGGGEPATHPVLIQFNESHFEFLTRRGREIGYVLRVEGDTLSFAPPGPASEGPPLGRQDDPAPRADQISHEDTTRLTVRVSAAQQVSTVEVRAWNARTREPIVASHPVENPFAVATDADVGQATATEPGRTYVVDDVPVADQAQATQLAKATAERIAGGHVHIEGEVPGNPHLRAGRPVAVDTPGQRFDHQVVLTRVTHRLDQNGYTTEFVASGGHDRSLLGLAAGARQRPATRGPVVATVTNVNDTEGLGRVKVSYRWKATDADGNLPETDWVRIVQAGAGLGGGMQIMPEVNDEVLVLFDQGDHRRPYVVGGLWNEQADVPNPGLVDPDAGTVLGRLWRSRHGHEVVLLDKGPKDDQEKTFDGVVVRTGTPTDGESGGSGQPEKSVSIALDAATGALTIEATGDVAVTGAKNITLSATESLTLDGGKKVTITGTEEISLN